MARKPAPTTKVGSVEAPNMTPAELRQQSMWLLAHARQLRADAEEARLRAADHRAASAQRIASLREKQHLGQAALSRNSVRMADRLRPDS